MVTHGQWFGHSGRWPYDGAAIVAFGLSVRFRKNSIGARTPQQPFKFLSCVHSMTLSASIMIEPRILTPSDLAVLRFMMISNRFGHSTGM